MAINFQHAEAIDNNVRLALENAMNTILAGVRQELEANGGTILVARNGDELVTEVVEDIYWDYEMCQVCYVTRPGRQAVTYNYYDLAGDPKEDE